MLLRRSCCCDGVAAAAELRSTSSVALILRVVSRDAQNDETGPGVGLGLWATTL